jgi:hypothetical protein
MTTALQLKLDDDQISRAERAVKWHEHALQGFKTMVQGAYLTGIELRALKSSLAHGQFMLAREQYFSSIPERTCQRYMAFVELLNSKSATLADLTTNTKMLTEGVQEQHREVLLKTIHDETDGKTMTQLCRDMEVLRDPKDPNDGEKKKPEQLTPEEQLQAWKERDTAVLQQAIDLMRSLITPDEERPRYFEKETRKAAQQLSIEFTKFLRGKKKEDKPKGKMILHRNPRRKGAK